MRIALLGLGRIGTVHLSHLASFEEVEVVLHDPGLDDATRAGLGVAIAATLDEALERADGVVVATPTALHAPHVLAAVDRGLPTFCEKPIAVDLDPSREVVARAEAAGVEVQVGFHRRFDPGFVELRRRIATGELGDLYLVRTACHDHVPPHPDYLATSGSIFRDMHTHDFDAIGWLTDRRIESVYAQGAVLVDEVFAHHGDVDTCTLSLRLEGGPLAVATGARADGVGYDHRIEVFGSRDSASAGFDARMPLRSTDPGGPQPDEPYPGFAERFAAAYRAEMAAFCDLVAGRGPNHVPAAAAIAALEVAVAADRSLATGLPAPVAEAS
ncbi:MAG: Gfo/Idh/MocA family oxidoreductase [Acidimicrobiales bacterium]|nr:Gfo/Idh/MocA family oxidoreductase [Acidimicrobiales bacterium]